MERSVETKMTETQPCLSRSRSLTHTRVNDAFIFFKNKNPIATTTLA